MIIWNYREYIDGTLTDFSRDKKFILTFIKEMANDGVKKNKIVEIIENILKNKGDIVTYEKAISQQCKMAKKESSQFHSEIRFSENEIKRIQQIGAKEVQSVLFALMVYCKSRGVNYLYLGSKSEIKMKDIADFARVSFSAKRMCSILSELYKDGDIVVEPNMKVILKNIEIGNQLGMSMTVSKNSIEWLEVAMGRGIYCERCGAFVKKSGNNKKYCPKCAIEVKKEKDKFRKLKN